MPRPQLESPHVMRPRSLPLRARGFALGLMSLAAGLASAARSDDRPTIAPSGVAATARRVVLVELYTSQGCDMCPEAERLLGSLGESEPKVAAVAFHVDYFNKPWHDPFSDELHSRRQMAYHQTYTGAKHPEYGLYFTPMVMVDGEQAVNGRDGPGIAAAVRRALAKPPRVGLTARVEPDKSNPRGAATVAVSLTPRSKSVEGRETLVCAVLRDDRVETKVASGENGGKTLNARFPARATQFEFVRPASGETRRLRFPLRLDPSWPTDHLSLVVFAQDKQTGAVHQTLVLPWTKPASPTKK